MPEHVKLIRAVLKNFGLHSYILSKFHQTKIYCLAYCITHERIEMDLEKVRAVLE